MDNLKYFEMVPVDQIKPNKENPRIVKDKDFYRLKKSIEGFPEMLKIRPIVVDENNIVIGGNIRFSAAKALGWKEIPVIYAGDLTDAQKKEFIIKDNINAGEWDLAALVSWNPTNLTDWGLQPVSFEQVKKMKTIEIKPYKKVHVLITFAPEMLMEIQASLEQIKNTEGVDYEQSSN